MYQYYIIEIKKSFDGEYEHNVHWVFDAVSSIARQKAESKYHEILTNAAISNTSIHSATLISDEGVPLRNECYKHTVSSDE